MSTELKLPEVGGNIEQGTVVAVLVGVGDTVSEGETLIELETEKAVIEVPSSGSGVIESLLVEAGETLNVGGTIATVGSSTPDSVPATEPAPAEAAVEAPAADAEPAAAAAPAAAASVPATEAGLKSERSSFESEYVNLSALNAAPNVRRLAREMGVDLTQVSGTGLAGRITYEDLQSFTSEQLGNETAGSQSNGTSSTQKATSSTQAGGEGETERREDMSAVRKATMTAMNNAWSNIPMVTHFDKADITETDKARKRLAPHFVQVDAKLTMTHVIIKALANSLTKFAKFNASVDEENQQIIYKEAVNVAVAVETEQGLLVPVIRDANKKSLTELVEELADLAKRARERKLALEEMQSATFTLSNLGGIGGTSFSPIINHPQVAILGVARANMEPVWDKSSESFQPRFMLPLSLTYDHRIIDGADAARFMRHLASQLQEPLALSL